MKLKSIIACGLLLLGVGAATTSCEDMFTAENSLVATDLAPQDTIYQVMGIVKRMQKLADRTVLLGEIRADLVEVDPLHAPADIQELATNIVSASNVYNKPADYYAVINNCNIYLAYVDTMRYSQGTRKFFEKEVCAVKCFRAWCYLELLKNYGEVPFVTEPVEKSDKAEEIVTSGQKADMKTILDFCINDLQKYPYMDENNELRQSYSSTSTYAGFKYDELVIPVRALLAELYLWRASYMDSQQDYINAIRMYHDYFAFPGEERSTDYRASYWKDLNFDKNPETNEYVDLFKGETRYTAGVLPLDTTTYFGNVTELRAVFNSIESNKRYPAVVPSQRLKEISKSQDYCMYYYDDMIGESTTYYSPHDANHYGEGDKKLREGDLRLYSVYQTASNFDESQFNSDVSPVLYVNKKYGGSVGDKTNKKLSFIPYYRHNTLYLHLAEALNRAGFPETAYAILKYGLSYYTLNNRDIISQDEYDRLCDIKSYGFTIQEPMDAMDSIAAKKTNGSFVVWRSNVFGMKYKKTTGGLGQELPFGNITVNNIPTYGGNSINIGIHSLGSGDTEYNDKYWLDDSVTVANMEQYPDPNDEKYKQEELPEIDALSSHEDSVAYQEVYDSNVKKDSLYREEVARVDAANEEYLASGEVRARRQARVAQLILEEEALEGMFEGVRFYDIMRYQMQDKKGGQNIGKTITMPTYITDKYGPTSNMTGKPWYLTLPSR